MIDDHDRCEWLNVSSGFCSRAGEGRKLSRNQLIQVQLEIGRQICDIDDGHVSYLSVIVIS